MVHLLYSYCTEYVILQNHMVYIYRHVSAFLGKDIRDRPSLGIDPMLRHPQWKPQTPPKICGVCMDIGYPSLTKVPQMHPPEWPRPPRVAPCPAALLQRLQRPAAKSVTAVTADGLLDAAGYMASRTHAAIGNPELKSSAVQFLKRM